MYLNENQIKELLQIAEHNDGKCDRCHRSIKLYKYRANKTMARILRLMANATDSQQDRAIDIETINLKYHERGQITKMRFHGLVAKVKDADGHHKGRHWLITRKGWDWLGGKEIPAKAVVYNNQVLGHEGGLCRIDSSIDDLTFEKDNLAPTEAGTYEDVRTPHKGMHLTAEFKGSMGKWRRGEIVELILDRLQTGKPITGQSADGLQLSYPDIAAFQRNWKIIKQGA